MTRRAFVPTLISIVMMAAQPAHAETTVGLEVRPRIEKTFSGNIGAKPAAPNFTATQRTRATISTGTKHIEAFASVQDVRTWSTETNTLFDFSADHLDLHEGFVELKSGLWSLKAGRQELAFDGQRLLGAVNWTQQARSFDALRLDVAQQGSFDVAAIWSRVSDGRKHDLFVVHPAFSFARLRLSVPLVFETNAAIAPNDRGTALQRQPWNRFTGGIYVAQKGKLSWRVEGYVQAGRALGLSSAQNRTILAYMGGIRVGYRIIAALCPTVWVDYLSGDSNVNDSTDSAFDTLFATNHKFYGLMDHFLNIPVATGHGGLVDVALKNTGALGPGKLDVALHYFLVPSTNTLGQSGPISAEADLVYTMPLFKRVALQVGVTGSIDLGDFRQRTVAGVLRDKQHTFHDWSYVQLDMKL